MFSSAHLALGLIIGKVTGDYPTAIISSTALDLDHIWPHARNKVFSGFGLKKVWFKKFWQATTFDGDTSRNYLHSLFVLGAIFGIITIFSWTTALVFALGCLGHLLLDALDNTDLHIFYPFKFLNTIGFVRYYSKTEFWFTVCLFVIYFSLFLFI